MEVMLVMTEKAYFCGLGFKEVILARWAQERRQLGFCRLLIHDAEGLGRKCLKESASA
jgi:hypothetical protein